MINTTALQCLCNIAFFDPRIPPDHVSGRRYTHGAAVRVRTTYPQRSRPPPFPLERPPPAGGSARRQKTTRCGHPFRKQRENTKRGGRYGEGWELIAIEIQHGSAVSSHGHSFQLYRPGMFVNLLRGTTRQTSQGGLYASCQYRSVPVTCSCSSRFDRKPLKL